MPANPIALAAILLPAATLLAAGAPNLTLIAQDRSVSGTAYVQSTLFNQSRNDLDTSPNLGSYRETASANAVIIDVIATGGASQESFVSHSTPTIHASGSAFSTAEPFPLDALAEGTGASRCDLSFTLQSESVYVLRGTISATDSGSTSVILSGASTIAFHTASGPSEEITISESGFIPPEVHTFAVLAQGSTYAEAPNRDYAFADYNLTLTVTCPGDVNLDGIVDVNDISYTLFRLGNAATPGTYLEGDANLDTSTNVNDISYILFRLGDTCI